MEETFEKLNSEENQMEEEIKSQGEAVNMRRLHRWVQLWKRAGWQKGGTGGGGEEEGGVDCK